MTSADADFWLWRVAWHGDQAYGVGYGTTARNKFVSLYRSRDGLIVRSPGRCGFSVRISQRARPGFLDDGRSCACSAATRARGPACSGTASPLHVWTWRDLGVPIGGPQMIRLPDGRLVAGVRLYDKSVRTALGWVDPGRDLPANSSALPSGGDTSYPGLVWHDGLLWVSYYSSHEGKTSIYLARVKLPPRPTSRNSVGPDTAELVMEIEETLGITFPERAGPPAIATVGDLYHFILE